MICTREFLFENEVPTFDQVVEIVNKKTGINMVIKNDDNILLIINNPFWDNDSINCGINFSSNTFELFKFHFFEMYTEELVTTCLLELGGKFKYPQYNWKRPEWADKPWNEVKHLFEGKKLPDLP
jgi:hypothetical protein